MALDCPALVERLCVLDLVPTLDAWEPADARFALGFWPWSVRRVTTYDGTTSRPSHELRCPTLRKPASAQPAERWRRSEGEAVRRTIRLHHTWAILLITLTAVSVAAQDKPDFSGRWVLGTPQQSAAEIPLALSVHQSVVRTTVRGDPMEPFFRDITIERQFETGTRSEIHLIGVQGGTVPGLRADGTPNGPTAHQAVKWDGNALVFESGSHTGQRPETGTWAERREVWSLDDDGRLRVSITTRSSGDGSRDITLVYRRP